MECSPFQQLILKISAYNSSLWSGEQSKFLILEYCETRLFARSSLHARSLKPTLMIFCHVSFSTHNMLDVNKQLKLKFNPLFEKNLEYPIFTDFILTVRINQINQKKYRAWTMREQLWSQRKTHWPKMIPCGGTLTVKCQPRESKRLKWRYMREDIESSRRGEISDIQEKGSSIVDQCSKDGVWPRLVQQYISSWKVCPEKSNP